MNFIEPNTEGQFVWPVGALCRQIGLTLGDRFNPLAIKGEISGFTRASSGHCYFTLKDSLGQLRCALFRRAASALNFVPSEGELVEISGQLGVYEPRGELQVIVERIRKAGQGDLFERFVRLKEKLDSEGLFAADRKRVPPSMPAGIGVVTSLGAAALKDVVITLQRRAPNVQVFISPAMVQGELAAKEMIIALEWLYSMAATVDESGCRKLDTILLVRGGGAAEDLWSFNDEELARVIARSPVPVISGVGHESDFTIADFVADVRAPTPTAAAELACASVSELRELCSKIHGRLVRAMEIALDRQGQRLDAIGLKVGRRSAADSERKFALDTIRRRLMQSMPNATNSKAASLQAAFRALHGTVHLALQNQKQRNEVGAIRLRLLDPASVLDRGYAMLQSVDGGVVGSVRQLQVNQSVRATLADGMVDLKVLGKL